MILRDLLIRFGFQFDPKGADDAERRINNLTKAGQVLLGAFAFGKVKDFFGGLLDQASKAQDEMNVMRKTFGLAADSVEQWANSTSTTIGRSKTSLIQYAGALGSILVPTLEGNREMAAEMSKGLAELAIDLGSFYHMTDEEVMGRLRSGMLGRCLRSTSSASTSTTRRCRPTPQKWASSATPTAPTS